MSFKLYKKLASIDPRECPSTVPLMPPYRIARERRGREAVGELEGNGNRAVYFEAMGNGKEATGRR